MFWSSVDLTGNQTVGRAQLVAAQFWSSVDLTGNQTSMLGRCPRAPGARASAVPPRPDGTWPRSRTQVSGFGDRRTAIVLARCV